MKDSTPNWVQQIQQFEPSANGLSGKVILVTGAGSGIGRALALACGRYGATVLLLGKTQAKLETVYDEIMAQGGTQPAILPMNLALATAESMEQLAAVISAEIGQLDGLVHCAAILGQLTPVSMYKPQLWQDVLQINLNAGFLLTKALLPLLKTSADASVIFTSSSVGKMPRAFWGAYAVSKAGIEALMQLLSQEHANLPDLRFNSVNPGAVRTQMRADAYPAEDPRKLKTPEQIVSGYLYLLSGAGRLCQGQSLDLQS